jgi:hypothetical protein
MRSDRNHTIVNLANLGDSICVAGMAMRRVLPAALERLFFGASAQLQCAPAQQPSALSPRRAASLRWGLTYRPTELAVTRVDVKTRGGCRFGR